MHVLHYCLTFRLYEFLSFHFKNTPLLAKEDRATLFICVTNGTSSLKTSCSVQMAFLGSYSASLYMLYIMQILLNFQLQTGIGYRWNKIYHACFLFTSELSGFFFPISVYEKSLTSFVWLSHVLIFRQKLTRGFFYLWKLTKLLVSS